MAKQHYQIDVVSKKELNDIMSKHHYLTQISRGFKSGVNVGLFYENNPDLLGGCIFTGFPVPELSQGCFGLERDDQEGLYELSRFVLCPEHQELEHNLASWFLARSLNYLRKNYPVRAVLSYADCDYHEGTLYRASNFQYFGLSNPKNDFWVKQPDGSFKKHSRGKTKGIEGEWRPRSRKHRFLRVFDKKLKCKWKEQ